MQQLTQVKIRSGDELLDARLDRPTSSVRAYAIFSHCFTCSKQTIATYRISRLLARQGIATLRFDFMGLGESSGDFANTTTQTMIDDIRAASDYLRSEHGAPTILLGHSMGGTMSLAAAIDLPDIEGIVTLASPSRPSHVLHHFGSALKALERGEDAIFHVAGTPFPIRPQFLHDVRAFDAPDRFRQIESPVLVIDAEEDDIVPNWNAGEIMEWITGDTERHTIAGAGHLISEPPEAEQAAHTIIGWLEKKALI